MRRILVKIDGVEIQRGDKSLGVGCIALHQSAGLKTSLNIFGCSSALKSGICIPLTEVKTFTCKIGDIQTYSNVSIMTKENACYNFVFQQGRVLDLIEILEQRRIILKSETDDTNYINVLNDSITMQMYHPEFRPTANTFTRVDLTNRITHEDFIDKMEPDGSLSAGNYKIIQRAIARKGLSRNGMPLVWCYLLKVYAPENTATRKLELRKEWAVKLQNGLEFVDSFDSRELNNFPLLKEALSQIEMDIPRTDVDNKFYNDSHKRESLEKITKAALKLNLRVGYCQGMADFAAVFLEVMSGDQVLAFACYYMFIERNGDMFGLDMGPMKTALSKVNEILKICKPELHAILLRTSGHLVAHPWILLWFKRCFNSSVLVHIWTMILNNSFGSSTLHYLVCAVLIAREPSVRLVDGITASTIFEIYRDVSEIPLEYLIVTAQSCRTKVNRTKNTNRG